MSRCNRPKRAFGLETTNNCVHPLAAIRAEAKLALTYSPLPHIFTWLDISILHFADIHNRQVHTGLPLQTCHCHLALESPVLLLTNNRSLICFTFLGCSKIRKMPFQRDNMHNAKRTHTYHSFCRHIGKTNPPRVWNTGCHCGTSTAQASITCHNARATTCPKTLFLLIAHYSGCCLCLLIQHGSLSLRSS